MSVDELREENEVLRAALKSVQDLIQHSSGVAGLHLDGSTAPWKELRMGGRFDEWLYDFDKAVIHLNSKNHET